MSQDASRSSGPQEAGSRQSQRPTVLAPLDGSTRSLSSLPVAKILAEILDAELNIVYVGRRILPPNDVLKKLGLSSEQMRGSIIEEPAGTVAEAIVRLAEERNCLVIAMCTHTGEGKPRGKLGSITEGVLYESAIPVMLVHPERGFKPWTLRHALFPHEGTPTTAGAIRFAGELTRRAGAEFIVLHVAGAGRARPDEPGTMTGPRYVDQTHHEWPAWAREFLTRAQAMGLPMAEMKVRLVVATGEPAAAIAISAREINGDLIVLAWRGHLEEERAATIKSVIHEASCPVLIIRVGG